MHSACLSRQGGSISASVMPGMKVMGLNVQKLMYPVCKLTFVTFMLLAHTVNQVEKQYAYATQATKVTEFCAHQQVNVLPLRIVAAMHVVFGATFMNIMNVSVTQGSVEKVPFVSH